MRLLTISLPMVEPLLDGARYFRPEDHPAAPGSRFHITKPSRERLARAVDRSTRHASTGKEHHPDRRKAQDGKPSR
jgi:hypothetical protein